MTAIAEMAAQLLADPRPVLFLDTCDILNAMEGLTEKSASRLGWTTRLIDALALSPTRVRPVVSYLVVHEWDQNLPNVRDKVQRFLENLDASVSQVYEAFRLAYQPLPASLPPSPPTFVTAPLIEHLIDRMETVLGLAVHLDRDPECIERALQRVMDRRRPSHKGKIKDSIILEHYLSLTAQIRKSGFADRCLFVSSNTSDFAADAKNRAHHPELDPDFGPPNLLEYFADPFAALASLGL